MQVKELISKLQEYDPEAWVVIQTEDENLDEISLEHGIAIGSDDDWTIFTLEDWEKNGGTEFSAEGWPKVCIIHAE